jgi:hypothetical protein
VIVTPFWAEYKKKGTKNKFVAVSFARQRDAIRRAKDYALIYGRAQVMHVKKGEAELVGMYRRVKK